MFFSNADPVVTWNYYCVGECAMYYCCVIQEALNSLTFDAGISQMLPVCVYLSVCVSMCSCVHVYVCVCVCLCLCVSVCYAGGISQSDVRPRPVSDAAACQHFYLGRRELFTAVWSTRCLFDWVSTCVCLWLVSYGLSSTVLVSFTMWVLVL